MVLGLPRRRFKRDTQRFLTMAWKPSVCDVLPDDLWLPMFFSSYVFIFFSLYVFAPRNSNGGEKLKWKIWKNYSGEQISFFILHGKHTSMRPIWWKVVCRCRLLFWVSFIGLFKNKDLPTVNSKGNGSRWTVPTVGSLCPRLLDIVCSRYERERPPEWRR